MGLKEEDAHSGGGGKTNGISLLSSDGDHTLSNSRVSNCSTDKDSGLLLCRVCHCVEADLRGKSALSFLGIVPPFREPSCGRTGRDLSDDVSKTSTKKDGTGSKDGNNAPSFVEFISPDGEIFICRTDVESGPLYQEDALMDLGCSCKNELALVHYACALKWFISHGSAVCEICGNVATNIRPADFNKVLASLKDFEALRERTATGEHSYLHCRADTSVDPDAIAGIRRQRLSEISSWFNPHNSHVAISQGHIEQVPVSPSNNSVEHNAVAGRVVPMTWSLESTGVFVAIGLGAVVLAWLVAPHVGKKAAVIGFHMLLGGLCALTIIIFLRFVFPKIQFGPMRCWAILFVFWFLVFGVWASRTHSTRSS